MFQSALLENPAAGIHFAHIYERESLLLESLSIYVVEGLKRGAGIVLVISADHFENLTPALKASGIDTAALKESGQLSVLDAGQTLLQITTEGKVDPAKFDAIVGTLMRSTTAKYPSVRAFGEMVNLLWGQGKYAEAAALEALWEVLIQAERFTLFCAYVSDAIKREQQTQALEDACQRHSHILSAEFPALLKPTPVLA